MFRCRFGSPAPTQTPLGWVESNGCCFQSLARRSRYSIWPLKFEFECLPRSKCVSGLRNRARHLGPTPRGRLKFGRMLACRTRTARNRRVKDARWSVTGPLSAASARYLRIGESDFLGVWGGVKARDFSKWRHRTAPNTQTGSFYSEFPAQIYSQATGVKSLCHKPRFF